MEWVLELIAGLAAARPAIFHSRQPAKVNRCRALCPVQGQHHTAMNDPQNNKENDCCKQQIKPEPMTAGNPRQGDNRDKHSNPNVSQQEMPALKLGGRRFALLQPLLVFDICCRRSEEHTSELQSHSFIS